VPVPWHATEEAMNSDTLKGKWKQLKGEAKIRWGRLTDDDLDQVDGAMDKLEGKLQERYGWSRDQVAREIEEFEAQRSI
jgi:uncharacterized protein YjbJ (UPF0337 family)